MTYSELSKLIELMTEEQKNQDVTFFDNRDEFFPVKSMEFADENCDVLDFSECRT